MSKPFSDLQSKIPTPVASWGVSIPPTIKKKQLIWNEITIPYFLYKNGGDLTKSREFLWNNRIGSAFTDLEPGTPVEVIQKQSSSGT